MKHKYHIKGFDKKKLKKERMKPLPQILFGKSMVQIMDEINKLLDKEITKITYKKCKNPKSRKPSKTV